ncbi:MAG: hypothetical protein Aureis2KO_33530 [Aureisphaera sp.]
MAGAGVGMHGTHLIGAGVTGMVAGVLVGDLEDSTTHGFAHLDSADMLEFIAHTTEDNMDTPIITTGVEAIRAIKEAIHFDEVDPASLAEIAIPDRKQQEDPEGVT